jgi:hypothetical protein
MGFFKNAIVKGLSGAAGAATLAITKNPALAATAAQLVNQHGHTLVDPAVKALVNHKFSFGKNHKLSARDILNKVKGVAGMVKNEAPKPIEVKAPQQEMGRDENGFIPNIGKYIDGSIKVTKEDWNNWYDREDIDDITAEDSFMKVYNELKSDDSNKDLERIKEKYRVPFGVLEYMRNLKKKLEGEGGGDEDNENGGMDVTKVKNKILNENNKMLFHDTISHMGRKKDRDMDRIGYEK